MLLDSSGVRAHERIDACGGVPLRLRAARERQGAAQHDRADRHAGALRHDPAHRSRYLRQ